MSDDKAVPLRRGVRAGLSIQSILLIMLLGVSILSSAVIGTFGYVNGRDSLRDAALSSLVEVRDSRAREVRALFSSIETSLLVEARGESLPRALADFSTAFTALGSITLSDDESTALAEYFQSDFAPALGDATGQTVEASPFIPDGAEQRYVSLHYTAGVGRDSTDYASAIEAHDDYFVRMAELSGYDDVLLINPAGDVVYSAAKHIDLGTNLLTGPFRFSALADAYSTALANNIVDDVVFTDFQSWSPALGDPQAWAVVPIASDGRIVGAFAVALPSDRLAAIMTTDGTWASPALGETGETYLVGSDLLMRTPSREVIEQPEKYLTAAVASGVDPDAAARAVADGTTVLVQPARSPAVDAALASETGTVVADGYLGGETLAAFAPLGVEDLDWVIVAELETAEAFAPVDIFTRNLAVSSAVILVVVALLSILLAQIIVVPLRKLKVAARRIAAGEEGVQVDTGSSDELAELGSAFNDMSTSLQVRADLLEKQQQENDTLLRQLMPESVGKLYRQGVKTIAQDHQEVSVIFADVVGFEDFGRGMATEKALELLNDLYRRFDNAAEEHGIERVRTNRQGYLASCGLTVPRVDHARRTVEFALEMQRILDRFAARHGAQLVLRAGIDSGTVTSGLIGRAHVSYDLWGDAVSLAFSVQRGSGAAGIFITDKVKEGIVDSRILTDAGTLVTDSGTEQIWLVDAEAEHV
jgi:class 3 adenylate cyclase